MKPADVTCWSTHNGYPEHHKTLCCCKPWLFIPLYIYIFYYVGLHPYRRWPWSSISLRAYLAQVNLEHTIQIFNQHLSWEGVHSFKLKGPLLYCSVDAVLIAITIWDAQLSIELGSERHHTHTTVLCRSQGGSHYRSHLEMRPFDRCIRLWHRYDSSFLVSFVFWIS